MPLSGAECYLLLDRNVELSPAESLTAVHASTSRNQTLGGAALIVGGALLAGGVVRFVLTERAARSKR